MTKTPLLELKNINKAFPGVKALDDVSLTVYGGEVVALLGENGAGKSTLMKILSGAYHKDSGEINIKSQLIAKNYSPQESKSMGIAIIYQELSLMSELSVAENIYITREPKLVKSLSMIDYKKMHHMAKEQLEKLNANHIDVKAKVGTLPLPERQMVEIAKALAIDCSVIIMDEPTTSLTWEETKRLFDVINSLKNQGVAVIYISHRLEEVFQICDRATIMRDGKVVGDLIIANTNRTDLISMMTGRELLHKDKAEEIGRQSDSPVLLSVRDISDRRLLKNLSFEVYEGEVLGFGGLIGAQRTELMRLIAGVDKAKSGQVLIENKVIDNSSTVKTAKGFIGYLSENRKEEGLNMGLTICENIILTNFKGVCKKGIVNKNDVEQLGEKYIKSLRIKGRTNQTVGTLSGGNQQKVAISKWLFAGCKVLIFDEPTRGIDVAAKAEIYEMVKEFARQGNAAIVVSSEVNELVDVCDRILIMSRGEIISELKGKDITHNTVLNAVTSSGGKKNA